MKFFKILFLTCAALFLIETGGAISVPAQKRVVKKKKKPVVVKKKKTPVIIEEPTRNPPPLEIPKNPLPANAPVVTQIDFVKMKEVFRSSFDAKKPLLVNFWATWCPPCREEFPDLVKIDSEFRPRGLDFVTITLDDLAEIKRDVPIFLLEMNATMPAYLLKVADEGKVISAIAPDWRGALPLTLLFDADGKLVYSIAAPIKPAILKAEIEKVIPPNPANAVR